MSLELVGRSLTARPSVYWVLGSYTEVRYDVVVVVSLWNMLS